MLALPPLARLSDDARGTAELVLAEVLNNVAEHAYAGTGRAWWRSCHAATFTGHLRCQIVDQGKAMPGGTLPEGRLPGRPGLALDDLPEGGFRLAPDPQPDPRSGLQPGGRGNQPAEALTSAESGSVD
jgi:serine/threonine-protein kinase RsbW